MEMSNSELQVLVERVSLESFKKEFKHQATFNARLRTTAGRYLLKNHHLEFNPKVLEVYGEEELIGIIKHELCHYHLHIENKGYQHKDLDFKDCLNKTKGSRYAKALNVKKESNYRYELVCKNCGFRYNRKRRLNPERYRCGKCNGPLFLREL